ncbi:type VI secretion system tube protein TssD [Marinifilum sp. RC60d5]|uniref:type VI secretion system tube protein TssD n=1 Tax=Marinifilum sp. RC60d5 TaxID=3458414 RepID=UPI0040374409
MSIKGKMYVDDLVYNIRRLDFGFDQKTNTNGTASSQPLGGLFNIEVESPKNTHLYAWGASKYDMKYVKLVFTPVTLATKSRTIELYDTLCIAHHDYFHSEGKDPMVSVLRLSPAIIVQDGKTLVEKNWKVTDLSRQNVEATAAPVASEEQEFTDVYLLDSGGSKIEDLDKEQDVTLVIKTTGLIGKTISTIDLYNEEYDFIYQGKRLIDDKLKNYTITSNEDRLALKVIEQNQSNS